MAGSIGGDGYRQIKIDGKVYRAARLAFLYMTGEWPEEQVDHINCSPTDDRWVNLRQASHSENQWNIRKPRDNTSGFKGVYWHRHAKKWRAQIYVGGRRVCLGYHADISAAAEAYSSASKKFHGQFGRTA